MDSKSQMDAVNADSSLAADAKQAKIRQIHMSTHKQVLKVLTPDQRKQVRANMKERRSEHQQPAQTAITTTCSTAAIITTAVTTNNR